MNFLHQKKKTKNDEDLPSKFLSLLNDFLKNERSEKEQVKSGSAVENRKASSRRSRRRKNLENKNIPSNKKNLKKVRGRNGCNPNRVHQPGQSSSQLDLDKFFQEADAFEKVLSIQNFDERFKPVVLSRLLKIQTALERKIKVLKKNNKDLDLTDEAEACQRLFSRSLSVSSVHSSCSLQSVASSDMRLLENSLAFQNFLTKIICPFCSNSCLDRFELSKHLDEDCELYRKENININKDMPYACFQILPTNFIKCNTCSTVSRNLNLYFSHFISEKHKDSVKRIAKSKKCTESVFCSCCKSLIPNSFTQLKFHMEHSEHKKRADQNEGNLSFVKKGICCIYTLSKKFKCLDCRHVFSPNSDFKEVVKHLENHKIRSIIVYCEFCKHETPHMDIVYHFKSKPHADKVRIHGQLWIENLELCFYCGETCLNLLELMRHMKSKCDEIANVRKGKSFSDKTKGEDVGSSEVRSCTSSTFEGGKKIKTGKKFTDSQKERCVFIKDFSDVLEISRYFQNFGEIIAVERFNENYMVVEFAQESDALYVMRVKDLIKINGEKIRVTDDPLEVTNTDESCDGEEVSMSENESDATSCESSGDEMPCSNLVPNENYLKNLFEIVGSHIKDKIMESDPSQVNQIIKDCIEALGCKECVQVGFQACGLSITDLNVSLFCDFSDDFKSFTEGSDSFNYFKLKKLESCLIKDSYIKLRDSKHWENVESVIKVPVPYIRCTHKNSGKECTITFSSDAKKLTDMLSESVEGHQSFQFFILIVRFWLTVHKLSLGDSDYVLITLIVFYLKSKSRKIYDLSPVLPNKFQIRIIRETLKRSPDIGMMASNSESPPTTENVAELFKKFLEFLFTFNFEKDAICLPFYIPIPKTILVSEELKSYWPPTGNDLDENDCVIVTNLSCSTNLASNMKFEDLESLLQIIRNTLEHYETQL